MATTVEIGVYLTTADAPYFRVGNAIKGKLNNTSYRLAGPIFYDITNRVQSVSTSRGKNRELDRYSAGNASVVLNNEDRAFDPLNTASIFYGNIIPRRQIRIRSGGFDQFNGIVEDWNLDYNIVGKSNATIVAADGFALLAQQTLTPGTYTKVTTDVSGRVTVGASLAAGDIPSLDASKITSGSLAVPVNTAGNVNAGNMYVPNAEIIGGAGGYFFHQGSGQFDAGMRSVGVYNTSVASGAWRAMYVNNAGNIGYVSSTREAKQDVTAGGVTVDAALLLKLVEYRRKATVAELGDDAPFELGLIAEDLVEAGNGLERFVFFDDDGKPAGVHYELLALALIPAIQAQAVRIDSLEERVLRLEK